MVATTGTERGLTADLALLIGRIALVALFLISGWGKLNGFSGTVGYLGSLGAPVPTIAAAIATAVELICPILIIIGLFTRPAALLLALFTIGATALAHQYWTFPVEQQQMQFQAFWKNAAIEGGLLLLAAVGAGRLSIDGMRGR